MSALRRTFILIVIALLCVGVAWMIVRDESKPATVVASTAQRHDPTPAPIASASPVQSSPMVLTQRLAESHVLPESAQARKAGLAGIGLPEEVKRGEIIERRDSPVGADGSFRRSTVYRTAFKYPFLRVEQTVRRDSHGEERVGAQLVMVADHVMVTVREGVDEAALNAHVAFLGAKVRRHLPNSLIYLVATRSPAIADFDRALSVLEKAVAPIAIAEPDFIAQATSIPNDSSFGLQWDMHNTGQTGGTPDADIDAPEAWNVTTGSASVVVAVIDTGTDLTHPDLAANIWTNPGEIPDDGIDNDGDGYIDDVHGWNFVDLNNSPNDDHGHGSHTSGTVGAVGGNGVGVTGVCQTVRIMPLKFLSASGSGSDSDAIEAIRYATAKGVLLSSNSWGGGGNDPIMLQAIQEANAAGVGFIAAAGNSGVNADLYPEYPANYNVPNVISVAATDSTDTLAWFSNYGVQTVHLGAPGLSIYSTTKTGGYATMSGTSMATPHVSGAAALLKAANASLTFAQIKSMLLSQADAKPSLNGKTVTGGRLNVANALVPATGPVLTNSNVTIDDSTGGDGNGVASPGESVNVLVAVKNVGALDSLNVQGALSLTGAPSGVTLATATASYGDIAAFATATNSASPFVIDIAPTVTPTDVPMVLTLTDDAAHTWTLNATLQIRIVATIAGTVTKITGGVPFEGATITITGPDTHTYTTDASGNYSALLSNGTYTVQATAPGYIPSAVQTFTIPPSVTTVNFALGFSQSMITPTSLTSTQLEGEVKTQTFTIHNNGDQALTYTILDVPPPENAASSTPLILSPPPAKSDQTKIFETAPKHAFPQLSRTRDAADWTATLLPFADDFEDGMWGRWFNTGGDGIREVVTTSSAHGSHSFHFHFNGPDDHFTGIHQEFDWQQPGHISFDIRPGAEDLATAYMVLLDDYYVLDNTGFHEQLTDFIWFFANANGRFYLNDDVGGNQSVVYTEGQWYHVEFRNIDWTAKKFDYWVDGQLVQTGVPFRHPDASYEMVFAVTYNYSGDTDMGLDDTKFYADALPWISVSSKQGSIAPGDTATITATFDASAQLAGHYTGTLQVRTNDPTTPNTDIAADMTVIATPNNVPVATPQNIVIGLNGTQTITLTGSDADNDPLSYRIVALPPHGKLYQTDDGTTLGRLITNTPAFVANADRKLIYQTDTADSGAHHGDFAFITHDPKVASNTASVRVDVTSWPLFTVTPAVGSTLSTPTNLIFKTSDPAAVVRLTSDGSAPGASSFSVPNNGSFLIDHTLTLTGSAAIGSNASPPQSFSYTFTDANNNGIPDWWESQHPGISSASADDDNDGFTNAQEFVAGTNPNQPDRFAASVQTDASAKTVTWASTLGRSYVVESSTDLQTWQPASPPQFGTGSPMSWQDSATAPQKFYRVRVSLQ